MTIDRLGEKTILVTLVSEDMKRYELDFGAAEASRTVRKGLERLMVQVGEECGIDHRDKSYLIEALPGKESCLLIISVRSTKPRRRYRIKRRTGFDMARFLCVDDLLDWMSRKEGAEFSFSIYRINGCYCLLPDYPLSARDRERLSEYAALSEENEIAVARIREFGEPVTEHTFRRRHPKYSSVAAR